MKLRSSTRQGTGFPNLSTKAPCNSTTDSAMSKALMNPLVLDSIFANIDITDLKTARLVCHDWSDVGAGLLGKRTSLEVNKLLSYDRPKLSKVTPVHDKLMRSLIIKDKFDLSVPTSKTQDVITKVFSELSPTVSQLTREIAFYVTLRKFETPFLESLRTLESPTQIQQISIVIHSRNLNAYKVRTRALQKLPTQQNLTSLKFQLARHIMHGGPGIKAFQPLLQVLIDSAPKLTYLAVTASFFPNLEECKNLKVLKFVFNNHAHGFHVTNMSTMLTPVKDSLTELELRYQSWYSVDYETYLPIYLQTSQCRNIDIPVMTTLTSLTINSPYVQFIQDFFDEEHLPTLKNLSINNDYFGVEELSGHLNLWKRHGGVQSFTLATQDFDRPGRNFGERIVQLFPAVKKLDLKLEASDRFVGEMIMPFQAWGLEEAKVVVYDVYFATWMVAVLGNMALWKGVKTVHFEGTDIAENDFSDYIQDVILHSQGFKRVEISGDVEPEIMEVMQPMFEASGAPVQFKGGVYRIHYEEEDI